MSERTVLTKTSETTGKSPSTKPKENLYQSMDSPLEQILHLQRTLGNQAVQRLIKSGSIQAKLKIGKPNDKYEQEADRIADKVMSMRISEPKQSSVNSHSSSVQQESTCPECPEKEGIQTKPLADQITPLVQRQADEEEEPVQGKLLQRQEAEEEEEPIQTKLQRQETEEEEEPTQTKRMQRKETEEEEEPIQTKLQRQAEKEENEEPFQTERIQRQGTEEEEKVQTKLQCQPEEEEEEPVQAKQTSNQTPAVTSNIEASVNSLKGGGHPLPESTRSYFEPRFGTDFSNVRLHTDSKATETAKSINAKAFTTGKNVVFGAGQYSPYTSSGKKLLAHELTHVVQQGNVIKRQPTSSTPTKTLNIPVIGQHWMQLFYWEHYWKPSIKKADVEQRQRYATFADIDDLINKLNDEIKKTKSIYYYIKKGRRKRINKKAKKFMISIAVIHRNIIGKLKPKVKRKTLKRLKRNYSNFFWWWSKSDEEACGRAAARLMRYGKTRIRTSKKTAFTASKKVKVKDTNWYKRKFGGRKVRLYDGRYLNYQLKYSKKRLLTLEKFIIKRINSGKPVHVRVLTAYIHKNYGNHPKSIHSIVINKYSGTVAKNGKVRFGFLDPDQGKKGELILDPNRSEDEKNSRFQSEPIGNPKWTNFGTTSKPEWFFGGNGPPWRYQVIRVDY